MLQNIKLNRSKQEWEVNQSINYFKYRKYPEIFK